MIAVTSVDSSEPTFLIARLLPDGRPDTNFGNGGIATTPVPYPDTSDTNPMPPLAQAKTVVIQSDGKILVAGSLGKWDRFSAYARYLVLARYQPDGSPDGSFGAHGDGRVIMEWVGGSMNGTPPLAVQPDGRILVAASNSTLLRFLPDGSLDSTFGNGGKVVRDDIIWGAPILQPDGKIVVVYGGRHEQPSGGIARLRSDGSPDASFGQGGDLPLPNMRPFLPLLNPDGKLLVAGVASGGALIARFHPDGSPDADFGTAGQLGIKAPLEGFYRVGGLLADGRVLLAVFTEGGTTLVRLRSDGMLDQSFGGSGAITVPGISYWSDLVLQPDGRLLVAFGASSFQIARASVN